MGYGRVGFGRLVDVFKGLGEQLVVPFDSHDLPVGSVVGFAVLPVELLQIPLDPLVLGDQQSNPYGRVREANRRLVSFPVIVDLQCRSGVFQSEHVDV